MPTQFWKPACSSTRSARARASELRRVAGRNWWGSGAPYGSLVVTCARSGAPYGSLVVTCARSGAPYGSLVVTCAGSGALRPPPPFAASLVPRCALSSGATPRSMRAVCRIRLLRDGHVGDRGYASRGWRVRRWVVGGAIGLLMLGALAARLYLLVRSAWLLEGDDALSALMALGVLDGDRPIMLKNQTYAAAWEPYAMALTYALLGISRVSAKLPALVGSLALVARPGCWRAKWPAEPPPGSPHCWWRCRRPTCWCCRSSPGRPTPR